MSIQMIAIQLLGLIPSVIAFTSLQSDNRKKILILQLLCSIMWGSHYFLLGAYTAVMTSIVGILRASICFFNDKKWAKSNVFPAILILMYIVSTIFTWNGYVSIFPCLSMTLTTIALSIL